jgi:large subunit ribosomal protein L3
MTEHRPRRGSLQYWPRKRAEKILPSANWKGILEKNNSNKLMGFIGYKVGMKSAYVKNETTDSMTKGKRISLPVTILECPPIKILSIRFYKNGQVISEVLGKNIDKELKRKIKLPKKATKKIEDIKDYDDLRILVYSLVKKTGFRNKPDISEIALGGSLAEKLDFVKEKNGIEISVKDVFEKNQLIDIRGVTKGKGFSGPVKRFGIALRSHKAEKGQRRPGSIGPWHPARVTFRVPMPGQLGMGNRVTYNSNLIDIGNINEKNINPEEGFKKFGLIKSDYVIINGSVQGPSKRQMLLTHALRPTKIQKKKNFELIELR